MKDVAAADIDHNGSTKKRAEMEFLILWSDGALGSS